MKTLCIYHGNCADGFGAAWVVRQALAAANVDFHAAAYDKPAPDVAGRSVIIVDFSYPLEALQQMAETATSILVIDHHKTAAEALAQLPKAPSSYLLWMESYDQLTALFDMHRSGAGMTWDFFFPDQPRPPLINHIEDRDLWQFKLEGTRDVMAAVFSHPQDFATWDLLMADHIEALRLDGNAIERKQQKDIADLVASNSRYMNIGGITVPAINLPHTMASDAGHLLSQGQPFAAIYWDTAEGRQFSLRSTDAGEDVSAIAKQYGGGGHRNAAGFRVQAHHELATGFIAPLLESTGEVDRLRELLSSMTCGYRMALQAGHARITARGGDCDSVEQMLADFPEYGAAIAELRKTTLNPSLQPEPVSRNDCGHWTHPSWPDDGDECAIPRHWFAEHGLEVFIVELEYDAPQEVQDAYFDEGNPDCSKWEPSKPIGDGWFIFSIHDTEDGPVCVWVRPACTVKTGEQP